MEFWILSLEQLSINNTVLAVVWHNLLAIIIVQALPIPHCIDNSKSLAGDILAKPVVSSEADLSTTDLDGGEYLLMLACDGVWDQLEEEEVFAAVREFVETNDSAGMHLPGMLFAYFYLSQIIFSLHMQPL